MFSGHIENAFFLPDFLQSSIVFQITKKTPIHRNRFIHTERSSLSDSVIFYSIEFNKMKTFSCIAVEFRRMLDYANNYKWNENADGVSHHKIESILVRWFPKNVGKIHKSRKEAAADSEGYVLYIIEQY